VLAAAEGNEAAALHRLREARQRTLAGPTTSSYLVAWVTEALCDVAVRAAIPDAARWVAGLEALAGRTGMRRLLARATAHRAALGVAELPAAA
jgi:hypothetical protein